MPNQATVVETSPTSHVVTIPTFSFHHHHHHAWLPLPPSSTPATAHVWANPGRGRRRHVTPTMTPTTHLNPATTPKLRHPDNNPNDTPDDAPQSHHVSCQLCPSTMPRHPNNIPNDATSRHRPSSTTTASCYRMETAGGGDGGEGWTGGGEREGRGERMTTTKSSLSPRIFC